jgi:hypothetical protein
MKLLIPIITLMLTTGIVNAQTWTNEQLDNANTAKDIEYISNAERDAIMYINLARLYPKDFAKYEVENYYGPERFGNYLENSPYRKSLISTLNTMTPVKALQFDQTLYEYAKCFAKEQGEEGSTGHVRKTCADGNFAECCSYGMETGKDIALQWLIDHDVTSLGHRENCLNNEYTKIGLSCYTHAEYDFCCVADMIW